MKKLSLATLFLFLISSFAAACDHCGTSSCDGGSHCSSNDSGLLDCAAGLFAKMKKSRKKSKKSNCTSGPDCGCEMITPDCGCEIACETAPSCGCEVTPPSCGCEAPCETGCTTSRPTTICSPTGAWDTAPGASCEPLLSRMFKFKKKKSQCGGSCDTCDQGCTTCEPCTTTIEPDCGCETACETGCTVEPSCGCEPQKSKPKRSQDGLLTRLFKPKSKQPDCGCEIQSSCGCEIIEADCEPACGCEVREPDCGCEPQCGCEVQSGGCHCQSHAHGAVPPMTYQTVPQVAPHAAPMTPSEMAPLAPVPAPAPPSNSGPQPVPDAQVDPFLDDAGNSVRRLPAQTIQYRKSEASYGESFDPQASNGVRVRFSDNTDGSPVRLISGIKDDSQARNRYAEQQGVVTASGYNHHGLREVPRHRTTRSTETISNPLR